MPSRQIVVSEPGRYLLSASFEAGQWPFTPLIVSCGGQTRSIQIPATGRYLLQVTSPEIRIDVPGAGRIEARPIRIRDWPFLLRNSRPQDHFSVPLEGATLTPLLRWRGREATALLRTLRQLAGWGFSVPSDSLQLTLERQWRAAEGEEEGGTPTPGGYNTAIVLHLHYRELWPEFEAVFARIREPFALIVTLNEPDPALERRVSDAFPRSKMIVYPNKGRDVGPFMQLLRDGHLDGFDIVCKLHGKRSGDSGPRAVLGAVWRWTLLRDLVGSAAVVREIIARFGEDPTIGMIGSRRFRLPNRYKQEPAAWGKNAETVSRLAARLGLPPEAVKLDYFAGTMFWLRGDVLAVLKTLDLSLDDFSIENGTRDGALEHALERLFGIAVGAAGLRIADIADGEISNDQAAVPAGPL